jgi:quercetin dioxygenase-like cupin family protein
LKPITHVLAAAALLTAAAAAQAQSPVFTWGADQQVWAADKPTQRLDVHADPAFRVVTRRVRIAPGVDLPPHGHDKGYRLVTVISGTLLLGFGERFDEAQLKAFPPGSVFSEPAGHKHFARTLKEPVVLQLTEVHP